MSHTHRPSRWRRRILVLPFLLLAATSLAACGDSYDSSGTTTTGGAAGTTGGGAGGDVTVALGDTDFGKVLVDADGRTLYAFTPDSATKSACTGGCAQAWPPAAAPSALSAADGVSADLTVISREDGSQQVAAGGHPLYTYAGDATGGDATGQGSGGTWFVVSADGSLVKETSPSTTAGTRGGY